MRKFLLKLGGAGLCAALVVAAAGVFTGASRADGHKAGLVDTDFIFGLGQGAIVKIDRHRWCRIVKREYMCFAVMPRKDWPSADEVASALAKHGLSAEGLSPRPAE